MNNIMDKYTAIVSKQFCFYAKNVMQKYYISSIFNEFLEEYINVRYYNIYPARQNRTSTVNFYLNEKINHLREKYDNKVKNIEFMGSIFKYLIKLDSCLEACEVNKIEDDLEKVALKFGLSDRIEFSKEYRAFLKDKNNLLKKYETNDFVINYSKIDNKVYDTSFEYLINMPELYSKKAIDSVYNSDPICDEKMFVYYNMLALNILNDVISYDYSKSYLVDFNLDLFNKKEKLNKLLKIFDNDISKEKVLFKVKSSDLLKNKKNVFDLISNGFNFVLIKDTELNEYDSIFKMILDKEV